MIKLTINNSYSQITGLNSTDMKALRRLLSYEIDSSAAYFSNNRFNTRKYLIDNKGNYPTGLTHMVKAYIAQNDLKCSIIDERRQPSTQVPLKATFVHKPYKSQLDATHLAITKHRGCLSMATGTGKSMVMALIINNLKVKTLIVVPNLELKRQLTEDLTAVFGNLKHITIENIDATNLETIQTKFDLLLIDEAHHAGASTYQRLNKTKWNDIYYRFYLTATPYRSNKDENILFEAIAGKVIYTLSSKEAINQGYIVPVDAYYLEAPKQATDAYTWQQVYKELVVENRAKNEIIADIILSFKDAGKSTLCLVKEIKHGQILSELTGVPFANGQDEDTRPLINTFIRGEIPALIATSGVCGEGVNTKACEIVIIACLGKAKGAFLQQVGRAIRNYPGKESAKVILVKDNSHKFTLKHFNEQKKILFDIFGITPVKLD